MNKKLRKEYRLLACNTTDGPPYRHNKYVSVLSKLVEFLMMLISMQGGPCRLSTSSVLPLTSIIID